MRQDNREIKVFSSPFEREIGEILHRDGFQWKVVHLAENAGYAGAFIKTFGKTLFTFPTLKF